MAFIDVVVKIIKCIDRTHPSLHFYLQQRDKIYEHIKATTKPRTGLTDEEKARFPKYTDEQLLTHWNEQIQAAQDSKNIEDEFKYRIYRMIILWYGTYLDKDGYSLFFSHRVQESITARVSLTHDGNCINLESKKFFLRHFKTHPAYGDRVATLPDVVFTEIESLMKWRSEHLKDRVHEDHQDVLFLHAVHLEPFSSADFTRYFGEAYRTCGREGGFTPTLARKRYAATTTSPFGRRDWHNSMMANRSLETTFKHYC